ncbi:MAG: hypothetical protein A2122_02970 [Candidatus Liptonbacteria bacterium GWB1_49_6]|uniref:Pesticidal crystal protein Cry22Aa Ig-like domain-containing protein n=1 Tax=Candidatus Liptonbacteria bacterium GWB1_49_6 TaxID=1798644 RepID=A0A1G2C4T1_9BACT|nr:MAG: hypothetical protein A2122_02970 [Candidatus Liptonbacteria bacterium GWB1_49_6]
MNNQNKALRIGIPAFLVAGMLVFGGFSTVSAREVSVIEDQTETPILGNGGGVSAADAVLEVTKIFAVQALATADGTFNNGWRWIFDVTVPTKETILKMKFSDWTSGSNNIAAADNLRFYSVQSSSAYDTDHAITVTAADNYGDEMGLISASDLDPTQAGRQIQITIEVKIPVNSAGGSYSANYGIFSAPDTTVPVITLTGDNPQKIKRASAYAELGATATDNADGTVAVTPDASAVDVSTAGTYTVTYSAVDAAGNIATASRIVDVELRDLDITQGTGTTEDPIGNLTENVAVDLTAYNTALAAVSEPNYTVESWTTYQAIVGANVVTAENNTQAEVDAATAAITAAQGSLMLMEQGQ